MILKRLLNGLIFTLALLLVIVSPVIALNNPDAIDFGTGAAPLYGVFYNVIEDDDWLITAEQYVYYSLDTYSTLRPDGAGTETNLTPSAGANWQCVSDSNDATYVTTNSTAYIRDLYSLADGAVGAGTITDVGINYRIINSGAGTTYGIPQLYINGNHYSGSAQTATTAWSDKSQVYSTNPATGSAWVWADINSMEVGISLAATSDNASCSEVWVVVSYTMSNPGNTASEAFLFELLNTSGNVTIASTPLKDYGNKPIGIYMSASQVASANLTVGTAYGIRIAGNPLIFPSTTGNNVTAYLGATDYVNQLLGEDGGIAEDNNLRNFMIKMANEIQTYDNPSSEYIVTVKGTRYLSNAGGTIFLEGIPSLDAMCPILFQYSVTPQTGDEPESTGAYVSTLSPLAKWGETVANGLTNLGVYLGINQELAGSVMLFSLLVGLAFYVYGKTQSGLSVLLLVGVTPFLGSWFGLMPLALAFIFAIVIVTLMAFFFFSRGTL